MGPEVCRGDQAQAHCDSPGQWAPEAFELLVWSSTYLFWHGPSLESEFRIDGVVATRHERVMNPRAIKAGILSTHYMVNRWSRGDPGGAHHDSLGHTQLLHRPGSCQYAGISDQSDQTWLCLCTNRWAYTNRLAGTNQLVHINRRGSNYVPHSIASHTLKHTNTIVLIFEWWYVRLSSVLTTFYPILIRCSNSNRKLVMNS